MIQKKIEEEDNIIVSSLRDEVEVGDYQMKSKVKAEIFLTLP
jgi:hypothetical protein